MKLTTYNSYKDSGEEWLGTVPAHWKVVPNRGTFTEVDDKNHPDEEMLSVTIGQGVIRQSTLLQDESMKDGSRIDKSSYKMVQPGDIAYNKMRAWQGALGASKYKGIISPAYVVQRPAHGNDVEFLQYLLRTPAFAKEAERWSYGIASDMWSLRPEHFKAIHCCIPPPDEQAAIVRFLDHADDQIRRYIAAKERLIALLEEERQALVHQAVTRGLDPNVRLKPSGVEWMGDVPEHWEVVPFKRRVGFREGPGIMAADFRESGVPLLRISCLCGPVATLDGCNYLDPDVVRARWSHFAIKEGDYLLSASASTGVVSLATSKVAGCVPYTGIIRLWSTSPRTVMPYVRLFLSSRLFLDQVDLEKTGVAISHFGPTHLSRMVITLPPEPEQQAIVEYIDKATAGIDAAVDCSRHQINFMNEYRTRLIADVVTGQLDVRKAAAQLPAAP